MIQHDATTTTFLAIGIGAGIASGFFGVGGGIIIVPALVFFAGFSQHAATGTSLAVLLPPLTLIAVLEYHRHGHVDIKAAALIACSLLIGSWLGALIANKLRGPHLRLIFGCFAIACGVYMIINALRRWRTG